MHVPRLSETVPLRWKEKGLPGFDMGFQAPCVPLTLQIAWPPGHLHNCQHLMSIEGSISDCSDSSGRRPGHLGTGLERGSDLGSHITHTI